MGVQITGPAVPAIIVTARGFVVEGTGGKEWSQESRKDKEREGETKEKNSRVSREEGRGGKGRGLE